MPPQIHTVTEVTRQIKHLLESNLPSFWIQGEVSNFTHHASGHMYFTLKDEQSQIRCVMWNEYARGLFFALQDGMSVLAQGDVTVYDRGGQYQFRVLQMQPAGVGDLRLAFERLKEKLRQEGLFDAGRKKPMPLFPQRIGVITSPSGAAVRDIVQIINRRFPGTSIILSPVKVQGEGAAAEIARAIDDWNRYGEADVLIVARGGGSLEDLWAFNEEAVARAIARSRLPVISAVGHEVDFTISDFVADLRAPTPSAAAEMVVPEKARLLDDVQRLISRSLQSVVQSLQSGEARLRAAVSSYGLRQPLGLIRQHEQRRDELLNVLSLRLGHVIGVQEQRFRVAEGKLGGLNPVAVLKRGFSICRKLPEKAVILRSSDLHCGDAIEISFAVGSAGGTVTTVNPE